MATSYMLQLFFYISLVSRLSDFAEYVINMHRKMHMWIFRLYEKSFRSGQFSSFYKICFLFILDWSQEAVSKAEILRLIYQGRFLHCNVTLGALGLPLGKTTVMHLVPRDSLPEPNSQGKLN